jgi:ABC-2 type transport system ATP-binding protein
LQVSNVSKSFQAEIGLRALLSGGRAGRVSRPAVERVSFAVEPGEIYGIIGANGSGKSTLVRMVSTLLLPDEGRIAVFGMDAVRSPGLVRPYINRVSADPAFFKNMSTVENLLFFSRVYGLTRKQVFDKAPGILRSLGFDWGKAREPMSNLSRGQQQKVALARSFLTSPVLMLLDEPTTGLDPRSKRDVQAFIRQVRAEHDATVLLTTHDMEEAEVLCNRIAFLARGRVVAEGTPLQLRQLVAGSRPVEGISMDHVFMELTGQDIEEDEVAVS